MLKSSKLWWIKKKCLDDRSSRINRSGIDWEWKKMWTSGWSVVCLTSWRKSSLKRHSFFMLRSNKFCASGINSSSLAKKKNDQSLLASLMIISSYNQFILIKDPNKINNLFVKLKQLSYFIDSIVIPPPPPAPATLSTLDEECKRPE